MVYFSMDYTTYGVCIPYKLLEEFSIATERSFEENGSETGSILSGELKKEPIDIVKILIHSQKIIKGNKDGVNPAKDKSWENKDTLGFLHSHNESPFLSETDIINANLSNKLVMGIGCYNGEKKEISYTFWKPDRASPLMMAIVNDISEGYDLGCTKLKKQIIMKKENGNWIL